MQLSFLSLKSVIWFTRELRLKLKNARILSYRLKFLSNNESRVKFNLIRPRHILHQKIGYINTQKLQHFAENHG